MSASDSGSEPQTLPPVDLSSVRTRAIRIAECMFWVVALAILIQVINAYVAGVERWLSGLERGRQLIGMQVPITGPDWLLIGGFAVAAAVPLFGFVLALRWYRRVWRRKLETVWPDKCIYRQHCRIQRHMAVADSGEVARRTNYLQALLKSPEWNRASIGNAAPNGSDAESYRAVSEAVFKRIEEDVRNRALVAGLSVGLSRNRFLDFATIASASLELQFHVLTRLGKKPSLRTWVQLWRRTAASLFVNTYLNREDCYAAQIVITKIALGLDIAGGAMDSVADHLSHRLSDVDFDEILPHVAGVPLGSVVEFGGVAVGTSLAIGADGVRRIGNLVEQSGMEILEGILAGGVLYFHGMGLAADCLALDVGHRTSPAMNITARHAVFGMCAAGGAMVRNRVRAVRQLLRDRRSQAVRLGGEKLKTSVASVWEWFRAKPDSGSDTPQKSALIEKAAASADAGEMLLHETRAISETAGRMQAASHDVIDRTQKISAGAIATVKSWFGRSGTERFLGTYAMAQGVNLHVTCQGGEELLIAPPGQPAVELISEDGSVFHTKTGNMRIRFVSGTDGEIERLDLDTGHSEVRYLRVRPKSRTAGQ